MSGIGPAEPGADTRARQTPPLARPRTPRLEALTRRYARHRRTALATTTALAALAAGGHLYTSTFGFLLALTVRSGPPVTVTRVAQPNAGLSVTSTPRAPFQTKSHSTRKITVTFRVTECGKAPRNAGFPFLDVTLRNARAIETHSFILGPRYAQHLSQALQDACGNDSP